MRRAALVLATCLCAVAGCRGSAAQEPYDGVVATERRATAAQDPQARAPEAESIASEVDVPWAIALLSDQPRRAPKRAPRVVVVDREPVITTPDPAEPEAEIQVAVDRERGDDGKPAANERRAAPKTCSGVVNRRS